MVIPRSSARIDVSLAARLEEARSRSIAHYWTLRAPAPALDLSCKCFLHRFKLLPFEIFAPSSDKH
jgi:hypothetical protein